jgi:hypothetical protein
MPEVGQYWFDSHGSPEVVRILSVDEEDCAFLVVNSIARSPAGFTGERIYLMDLENFLEDYQDASEVDEDYLDSGSVWFYRTDLARRVVLEDDVDVDNGTVSFRQLREEGVGSVQRASVREFVSTYVRIDDDDQEWVTNDRFWVVGGGICAVFVAEVDAQAFLFETCVLLNQATSSLRIYRTQHPAVPAAAGNGIIAGGGTLLGTGGGSSGNTLGIVGGDVAIGGGRLAGMGGGMLVSTSGIGMGGGASQRTAAPEEQPTLWERLADGDD